jgi:anaerobic magnesium-protoporphyrin IX monomethyl ester cyclase
MNVLLLSMPDSFEHMPTIAIRIPNGALSSLAGNVDAHHRVSVADLILAQRAVRPTIERLVRTLMPDLVGLSVMTFQRRTARRIVRLLRTLNSGMRIVVGGYDPSLAPEAYEAPAFDVDFIVTGEGEQTFRELLQAIEGARPLHSIPGLSFRTSEGWVRNPSRPVSSTAMKTLALPKRSTRALKGYTMLGRQIDVVETSRGCTYDCSFCSIIEMRGRNFYTFDIDRVLDDIRDARAHGARVLFFVDDNITLDVKRFERFCVAIIDARLNDLDYYVQAMTSPIAAHGETLAPLMRRAGFRYVFLGIENLVDEDLQFLRARSKNAVRDHGRQVGNASQKAIEVLHRHGMYVTGGLIVGNPGDTRESIQANLDFARAFIDWPYIQHPTPYPRTPMAREFRERGLIVNENLEEYDGTTAVVRSEHLSADEIEFLRWHAERWMKLRHFPVTLWHDPWFVMRHGHRMIRHTFRGSTLKSWLGLEASRVAFERFRRLRRVEREYLPELPGQETGPGFPDITFGKPTTVS